MQPKQPTHAMPPSSKDNPISVPEQLHVKEPLALVSGTTLPEYTLTYETYGRLNEKRNNAILVCHALSGNHHVAGVDEQGNPGWWSGYIGPGKTIDTNQFFVVCSNNLGGCHGSTGPTSLNPKTGKVYGADFPMVTCKDWVKSQDALREHLGIEQWAALVGGSMGGMQVMQWAIDYPDKLRHALIIAAAPKLSAQNIAFNEVARQAIMSDPAFHAGRFIEHDTTPKQGLALARMLGHLTYLSDDMMGIKFGRALREDTLQYNYGVEFQVESYLRYQGEKFATKQNFDANTYLLMTKALDYFDPAAEYEHDLSRALARAQAKFLVVSFTSDWRFSPARSHEIVKALLDNDADVSYAEISSEHGHDAFLLPNEHYQGVFSAYMSRIEKEITAANESLL